MTALVTVLTPTHNRAHTLKRAYESIANQTDLRVKWLVMDDGSSDNTSELIQALQAENKINIEYHFHENRHKFISVLFGIFKIETPYFLFLDSDDELLPQAIETYLKTAESLENPEEFITINALDMNQDGDLIGTCFPEDLKFGSILEMRQKYRVQGDKTGFSFTENYKKFIKDFDYSYFDRKCYVPQNVIFSIYDAQGMKSYFLNEILLKVHLDRSDSASVTSTRESGKNLFGLREGYRANLNNYKSQLFGYPSYLVRQLVGFMHYATKTKYGFISSLKDISYFPYKLAVFFLFPLIWGLTKMGLIKRPGV